LEDNIYINNIHISPDVFSQVWSPGSRVFSKKSTRLAEDVCAEKLAEATWTEVARGRPTVQKPGDFPGKIVGKWGKNGENPWEIP